MINDVGCSVTELKSPVSKEEFSEDEEMLIGMMFRLVGERWSLIAGRIPGRSAEDIEKYWNSKKEAHEVKDDLKSRCK
ncbi:Myb_DNA-binding domain-containing protein [Cephalotus follicularis]|uniref:Myb_DNA-binding domain-containing protein n=1 Tax=Cephalotus follicularis TaxID=3775 RepID=A0A1Q3CXW1_CEPFO|nr:Myb_DNA-binding domain-containing protein [Cephalotus follicularis]